VTIAAGYDRYAARVLTVRVATPQDAADIVRINVHGWRLAYAGIVPDDVLAAMDVTARVERYRQRMGQSSQFESLLAQDSGATIGYTSLGPYRIGQHEGVLSRRVGEVVAIYVDPPRWGTGAGRALMDAALARLAARGFSSVRLWVLADNGRARRFYERAGFTPDGARAAYPVTRPDGSVVDLPELRYARLLP
jgi:ribosomal protein S18 acetylase RimI-like enzyme